jgi:YbbR domain-containing protein
VKQNLALKAISLLLAVLLWVAIAASKTSEVALSAPVELQNVPKDLELTGDTVNAVEVRLRSSPGIIERLGPGEVAARIDLRGAAEGERIIHLTQAAIRVPFGIKVVRINPSILTLTLERTIQKLVPVRPRFLGKPAKGHELGEISSEPAEVRVVGPRSRVQEVESAYTEPISIDGAESGVSEIVSLGIPDPGLRIEGESRVRVTAKIREVPEQRTLSSVVVEVRGSAAGVYPGSVDVTLIGPPSAMARLQPHDVKAYVDGAALSGAGRAPVAVELAPGLAGVSVTRISPDAVSSRGGRKTP